MHYSSLLLLTQKLDTKHYFPEYVKVEMNATSFQRIWRLIMSRAVD